MIVSAKINYFKALQVTGKKFLFFVLLTLIINQFISYFHWEAKLIPQGSIVLMSSALGIFLGFRINAAYSRWRDGHGLFRDLMATSLSVMAQITVLTKNNYEDLFHFKYQLATLLLRYVHLVRLELAEVKGSDWHTSLKALHFDHKPLFSKPLQTELLSKRRKGSYVLGQLSKFIHQSNSKDEVHFIATGELAKSLQQMIVLEQTMVSLKETPFPWGYKFYTRFFVWLLPFLFMVSAFNHLTLIDNLIMSFISTLFVTTEQIASNLDDPIKSSYNGVPFNYLCRMLEIELLEHLHIAHDLQFVAPDKGILH